jgi:glycosyltransferase involved in cell wall biosynthesis
MTVRVLHVHAGNLYGGVETILVTLARNAEAAPDVEHRFALCFDGRLAAELRQAGAHVDLIGATRISRPWTVVRARRHLRDYLSRPDIGVVVCHSAWSQAIFGPVIRAAHVPSLFWLHGAAPGPSWLERWARRSRPDHAICVSRFTASALPRLFPGLPYAVISPPVAAPVAASPTRRSERRRELGTRENDVVILQASRMEEGKGHRVLIEALATLVNLSGWVCWLAGGAQRPGELDYERSLRTAVRRLGLSDRVHFLGSRSDLPELLLAADVFCQPSTAPEGFGLSAVEALYAGLPVVASATGATLEIVDDSCGVGVPPADAPALGATLRRLIEDAGARARLAAHGPARAQALCDPTRQVRAVAELCRQIAHGRTAA